MHTPNSNGLIIQSIICAINKNGNTKSKLNVIFDNVIVEYFIGKLFRLKNLVPSIEIETAVVGTIPILRVSKVIVITAYIFNAKPLISLMPIPTIIAIMITKIGPMMPFIKYTGLDINVFASFFNNEENTLDFL